MGASLSMVCVTCKKIKDIGCGCYTRRPPAKSLAEAKALDPKAHWGVDNLIAFFEKHEGHEHQAYDSDCMHMEGDDLYFDCGGYDAPKLLVTGYAKFELE